MKYSKTRVNKIKCSFFNYNIMNKSGIKISGVIINNFQFAKQRHVYEMVSFTIPA